MADTKLHEGNTLRHFVFTFSTYKKKNDFIESIGKLVHCGMQKIFSFTSIVSEQSESDGYVSRASVRECATKIINSRAELSGVRDRSSYGGSCL